MNHAFQLILLPGLGTDHRLLESQRAQFPQLAVPPWIPPRHNESLAAYALRMAETVKPSGQRPLLLGGVSLGGMLACEMARHLKPDALVLIASCRTRHGLRSIYKAGRPLLPLIPLPAWSIAKLLAAPAAKLAKGVPPHRIDLAIRMFKEADSRFMHWALQALLRWEATPLYGVRVFQIHGCRDLLIPADRVPADVVIPDGGHLINVTHAAEVNEFIAGVAAQTSTVAACEQ